MKSIAILVVALSLMAAGPAAADSSPGKLKGGAVYALPPWFKASFMDLRSDIEEANDRDKHVMLFLHLDECPYCARMLKESFTSGSRREFIEKNFDVIGVNVQGSLEVTWVDGTKYTERTLSRYLRTFATPTIVFLGADGKKVLQITGYRDPGALRDALEYVKSKSYSIQSFTDYVAAKNKPAIYTFRENAQFSNVTDFKGYKKPLAILFEDQHCAECTKFHETTLNRPDVVEEMKKFLFVRLDADSNKPIVDLNGAKTTPAAWAKALDLTYRPAVVMFNEGREMFRADGRLFHFHFKEALHYVGGAYYKRFDTLSQFRAAYRSELLKKGINIDFAE
ncbi:MAG: thioredoxin fold domain-containing protein [Burkholderiales bacterium]|nr:thioredoxin fold domain-containing protein [Burkholderiales bacterium]